MRGKYTRQDLLKQLYGETEPTENQAIEAAFILNYDLKEEYDSFEDVKGMLSEVRYTPSESAVQNILRHSGKIAPEAVF